MPDSPTPDEARANPTRSADEDEALQARIDANARSYPGTNVDIYFGDPDEPQSDNIDYPRNEGEDVDEDEPTPEEKAGFRAVMGFDADELWADEPEVPPKESGD